VIPSSVTAEGARAGNDDHGTPDGGQTRLVASG
jgi:hypothetical protein